MRMFCMCRVRREIPSTKSMVPILITTRRKRSFMIYETHAQFNINDMSMVITKSVKTLIIHVLILSGNTIWLFVLYSVVETKALVYT